MKVCGIAQMLSIKLGLYDRSAIPVCV